ncbi:MAG: ribosomal protein [Planctomycetota bacterium]
MVTGSQGTVSTTAYSWAADMSKARELREMSDEQIRLVWKDSAETLFKLRLQAQTEKLSAPTDVRKQRRSIARCQTILAQRGSLVAPAAGPDGAPAESKVEHDAGLHDKHGKKKRAIGRAKVQSSGKAGVATKRQVKKRTQSGK